ncbi:MAG: effector-associated domain EAD1-containing protein [Vicinamibacterales bacterium]
MPSLNLSGDKLQRLSEALRVAYPMRRFAEMLQFRLSKRLEEISLGADYREIVFDTMMAAEAEGWTAELVLAARQSNPANAALLAFAQEVALAAGAPQLERTVKAKNPFLDVELFRTRLGELEAQVCRIEIDTPRGTVYGTGFLLGPDLVLTNHHVMDQVVAGTVQPSSVVFRFDYKKLASAVISQGSTFALAADWLVDCSPPSAIDLQPEPKQGVPSADELDYALVRLDGSPGTAAAGAKADPNAPPRGWIKIGTPAAPTAESPLFILQHPDSAPLKLALDMSGVIGPNGNGTRLKYGVNTEGGSSGAPCFNVDWELVALHHSGDPNFDPDHKPQYNEGIPIDAILALLTQRGKRDQIA